MKWTECSQAVEFLAKYQSAVAQEPTRIVWDAFMPFQFGKTAAMLGLIDTHYDKWAVIYWCADNKKMLQKQMKDRFSDFVMDEKMTVLMGTKSANAIMKGDTAEYQWMRLNKHKPVLIIIDEVDYGIEENQLFVRDVLNKIKRLWTGKQIRIVGFSATGFRSLLVETSSGEKPAPALTVNPSDLKFAAYRGPKFFKENNLIFQADTNWGTVHNPILPDLLRNCIKDMPDSKYGIVRVPKGKAHKDQLLSYCKQYNIKTIDWTQDGDSSIPLSVFERPSLRKCLVLVVNKLRQGETISGNGHIGFLYDYFGEGAHASSVTQSFLGRACGHNKYVDPLTAPKIYTYPDIVDKYITAADHIFAGEPLSELPIGPKEMEKLPLSKGVKRANHKNSNRQIPAKSLYFSTVEEALIKLPQIECDALKAVLPHKKGTNYIRVAKLGENHNYNAKIGLIDLPWNIAENLKSNLGFMVRDSTAQDKLKIGFVFAETDKYPSIQKNSVLVFVRENTIPVQKTKERSTLKLVNANNGRFHK